MAAITIQRFHEDIEAAEKAAMEGPVFIFEDGRPRHVLIDMKEYHRLNLASTTPPFRISLPFQTKNTSSGNRNVCT